MLKGNHRYNGMLPSVYSNRDDQFTGNCTDTYKTLYVQNHVGENEKTLAHHNLICNNTKDSVFNTTLPYNVANCLLNIKKEELDEEPEQKIITNSIIDLNHSNNFKVNKLNTTSKFRLKQNSSRSTYHESLQRIGGGDPSYNHYQQHWFHTSLERLKFEDKSREERLETTRYELQRHLKQITQSNLGKCDAYSEENVYQQSYSDSSMIQRYNLNAGYDKLVSKKTCDIDDCKRRALPCTRYCTFHIMHNAEQVLFDYCTAKFADNTQCSVPVFDITHELPLCPEHARKRDNYRMYQETKPKKLRKKVKPSAMIRPQKRSKKKKRPTKPPEISLSPGENKPTTEEVCQETPDLAGDMVEQVLALQESDGLELVSVEQALVTQASNLLEESEINNVLSTIQADEFNDFFTEFTVNRNGEYEPTREETEELERALAAVDNDVKSLEKLTQSQGLLDPFLDENTLVESLVQIPDVFHNGYVPCGENIVTQTTRLLSVEPHSQS